MVKQNLENLTSPYYTRQNLELILGSNRRTLDYRISKLISGGVLEAIKPGFYLNKALFSEVERKEEFLEYVGSILKYPSYVSLEYALSKYNLILESIFTLTYITKKKPGEYNSDNFSFKYRNIKDDLFSDYKECEFNGRKYFFAKKYKALFDFIYLTPLKDKRDYEQLLLGSRINWGNLSARDKKDLSDVCMQSGSEKMVRAISFLNKKDII